MFVNKISLKKIKMCSWNGYIEWLLSPKFFIFLAAIFFFYDYATVPLLEVAEKTNSKLNFLEIFIAIGNSGMILLIMPVLFIVLISDFPKNDNSTLFFVIRTGKYNWLISQYLQLIYMVVTYIAVLFIGTVIPIIGRSSISSEWSKIIIKYIADSPEKRNSFVYELLPENLSNQHSLVEAFIYTLVFETAFLIVIGMINIVFNTFSKSLGGTYFSCALVIVGTVLCAIGSKSMWIFPTANATLKVHYTQFLREPVFSIAHSYLYFITIIVCLLLISIRFTKKCNYS